MFLVGRSCKIQDMFKERETKYLKYSDEWLIDRFFKFGSIDSALWDNGSPIPFSYMSYYRKLSEAGIIRSAGRQTSLTEALHFFRLKQMEPGMPLESIYKELPPSFKTSINTLHRIYNRIEKSIPGRFATALVISHEDDLSKILVGSELSSNRLYGKSIGDISIPMTFSHLKDTKRESVVRVLQQEVFTNEAVDGKFSNDIYTDSLLQTISGPYLHFRILDVEVACYKLVLPANFANFSSYKLSNLHMENVENILNEEIKFRIGVSQIVRHAYATEIGSLSVPNVVSTLNISLFE